MDRKEFREEAHRLVDWMADYLESIEDLPVRSQVQPGEVAAQIPQHPPTEGEAFPHIFQDFLNCIVPGMTHWQHPSFFAYFPANSSPPSLLAEMLTATLGAQCMSWETSPAATELEERMLEWVAELLGMPKEFRGAIYEGISIATIAALAVARTRVPQDVLSSTLCLYGSTELHTLIDRVAKVSGFSESQIRKIPVRADCSMDVQALRDAIAADKKQGLHPFAVVAAFGTTSTCAIDSLREIGALCQDTQLWLHVDAAYAGTALILPEYRYLADGIEFVDSFAFNPNKWMFTNFDCTCFYTKQYELLRETLRIEPSYLKPLTEQKVTNYRDVSIPLGRRFRALKLWFVLRSYGVKGIQEKLRLHIQLAQWFRESIDSHPDFELVLEPVLNVICFRFHPSGSTKNDTELDELNRKLLRRLNQSGELYLSGTLVHNVFALRFVPAQTYVAAEHVSRAFDKILATAASL